MINNFTKIGLSIATVSMLFIGCGSSGSGSTPSESIIKGVVSDGLINEATVKLMDGSTVMKTTTTDINGTFTLNYTIDSSKSYTIVATGGIDTDTNEDFSGVNLKAPLTMFDSDKKSVVVSPLTSLVTEEFLTDTNITSAMNTIKNKLDINASALKIAPHTDLLLQKKAMKLSLMAKEGISFSTIIEGLTGNDGIDDTDIEAITNDVSIRIKLKDANSDLDVATSLTNIQSVYKKKRYLREIISTGSDLNLSNTTAFSNLKDLANIAFDDNADLKRADIIASLRNGISQADVNDTIAFTGKNFEFKKVATNLSFADSMKVLYYNINNPKTGNEQLLAFDYTANKAYVVNTNVILKDKVFIYEGEKDGNKSRYTSKKYGLYLDPEQAKETRTGINVTHGQQIPFTYNFYTDNALMKFDAAAPTTTSYIFQSSDIPQSLKDDNLTKLSAEYKVLENIVDPNDSYISLTALNSLADSIKGETDNIKKQSKITVRLGDSVAVAGEPLVIIKNSDMTTSGILVSYSEPYIPNDSNGSYSLLKYNSALDSNSTIAVGQYYYATQNDDYIYLFKKGSNKLWSYTKNAGNSLTEVTGITLAGDYDYTIHSKGSRHGSSSNVIDGSSTVSGRNPHLSDGTNAYVSFHYDLHESVGELFAFGEFGAYKSAQVFKINGTTGTKIFDNGDSTDESLDNAVNSDPINGHINLVAVSGDKLYTEIGWYDGNSTLGGNCTKGYPSPASANGKGCIKVKYGYLDTTVANATDATSLMYDDNNNSLDKNLTVTGIPYYVSRRIAPLAADGKLYISTFAGGSKATGYKYKQYIFNLGDVNTTTQKDGRTYFAKTAKSESGIYSGIVMAWDLNTQTIKKRDGSDTLVANTSDINGKAGASISATTNGVPLSGIGNIGMLKNNIGNHEFELFAVDVENNTIKYIDFAPYGGWIYE